MDSGGVVVVVLSLLLSVAAQFYKLTRGSCPENYLTCYEGQSWRSSNKTDVCFHEKHLCDNETDCSDSSDEKFCPGKVYYGDEGFTFRFIRGPCLPDQLLCKSGGHTIQNQLDKRCIKKNWVCGGVNTCYDNSDEKYCPYDFQKGFNHRFHRHNCPQGYYGCRTGSPKYPPTSIDNKECIPRSWICDGNKDCNDTSDEAFCPYYFPEDLILTEAPPDTQSETVTPETTQTVELTYTTEKTSYGFQEAFIIVSDSNRLLVLTSFFMALTIAAVVLATAGYYFWSSRVRPRQQTHSQKMSDLVEIDN